MTVVPRQTTKPKGLESSVTLKASSGSKKIITDKCYLSCHQYLDQQTSQVFGGVVKHNVEQCVIAFQGASG